MKTGRLQLSSCCVCSTKSDRTIPLSSTYNGAVVQAVLEDFAAIQLETAAAQMTICDACWSRVKIGCSIRKKILESQLLKQRIATSERRTTNDDDTGCELAVATEETTEDYEYEFLEDEYLEPSANDHNYGFKQDQTNGRHEDGSIDFYDEEALDDSDEDKMPVREAANISRLFEMPRQELIMRNEVTNSYRHLQVVGERCCGCSYIGSNRKELMQHSGSVHAVSIHDSGDYCPICFYKFASDKSLERHINEFRSKHIFVCLQCNWFFNSHQRFEDHVCRGHFGKVDEDILTEVMLKEEENIESEYEDEEDMMESMLNVSYVSAEMDIVSDSARILNEASEPYDEGALNIQIKQISNRFTFDTFIYIKLAGERCCGCDFICDNPLMLSQHSKKVHQKEMNWEEELVCKTCYRCFDKNQQLVNHTGFYTSKDLFVCTICKEVFISSDGLKHHQKYNFLHKERVHVQQSTMGIEVVGSSSLVEIDKLSVLKQLVPHIGNGFKVRVPQNSKIRRQTMPDDRFITNVQDFNNYQILSVIGERCCGCSLYFDDYKELIQHAQQEHARTISSDFCCRICYTEFSFERGLMSHQSSRKKLKQLYYCKVCGILFVKKYSLAMHFQNTPNHMRDMTLSDLAADPDIVETIKIQMQKSNKGEMSNKADIGYHCCLPKCKVMFNDEADLFEHVKDEHAGKRREHESERHSDQFVCPMCNKSFDDGQKLVWHRFTRFVKREYYCKHCNEQFSKWNTLNEHVQTVHDPNAPKFKCELCEKTFVAKQRLRTHMKTHSSHKDFGCDVCGVLFSSKGQLKRHRRAVHGTEHPFECKQCPKKFAVLEKLKIHNRVHTGERPYKCSHCKRSFAHFTDRKRHEMSIHTGERPHKCKYCPAAYIRNRELALHIKKHIVAGEILIHVGQ